VGDAWQLDIPDAGGFTFAVGEQAYLELGDPLGTVTLSVQDPNDAKRWAVRDFASISQGAPILVRRAGQGSAWNDFYDVMNFTTQGGLGTFVFTQTWACSSWATAWAAPWPDAMTASPPPSAPLPIG
jgi:hypothetical protein